MGPIGIWSHLAAWPSAYIFSYNFIAVIPLAGILGSATESLAVHVGQTLGGLLNATFGNAVEMIVTVQAVQAGLITVVKGTLLGSVISNLLLVLGMSFFAAGMNEKESFFSKEGSSASTTCLALGGIALGLPTIYASVPDTTDD